jgi:type III secretion protein T
MPIFSYTSMEELLALGYRAICAGSIAMARATGIVIMTPVFARLGLTGLLRTGVAFVISLPILGTALPLIHDATPLVLLGISAKELLLGVLLGLALGVPFWAAEMAGELIDLQRGSTMAQLIDPSGSQESSVTATLLHVIMLAMFFQSGGFHLLLEIFYDSYRWWNVASPLPVLAADTPLAIVGLLDRVAHAGVIMAGPLAIAVLGTDIAMAYLARMSPRLHTFDLSLPVKSLVFATVLAFYVSFLLPSLGESLGHLHDALSPFLPGTT